MTTWNDLAMQNRESAYELVKLRHWRSCVSRAYYASYAAATQALIEAGVVMPAAQPNPSHKTLPLLIGNNLPVLAIERRWQLSGIVAEAYRLRIIADDVPSSIMIERDARNAMGLMQRTSRVLEV